MYDSEVSIHPTSFRQLMKIWVQFDSPESGVQGFCVSERSSQGYSTKENPECSKLPDVGSGRQSKSLVLTVN
jgi:hypothetical protein